MKDKKHIEETKKLMRKKQQERRRLEKECQIQVKHQVNTCFLRHGSMPYTSAATEQFLM